MKHRHVGGILWNVLLPEIKVIWKFRIFLKTLFLRLINIDITWSQTCFERGGFSCEGGNDRWEVSVLWIYLNLYWILNGPKNLILIRFKSAVNGEKTGWNAYICNWTLQKLITSNNKYYLWSRDAGYKMLLLFRIGITWSHTCFEKEGFLLWMWEWSLGG